MLPQQFYPTSLDAQGYSLTDTIQNLTYGALQDDPLRPYTMGYVPYDDYPHILDLSIVETNFVAGGVNSIDIKSATIPNNMPWGYLARVDTVWTPAHQYSINIFNDNGVWRPQWLANKYGVLNARFINSGYLAKYTLNNDLLLTFSISVTLDDESTRNGTEINKSYTFSDYFKFTEGDLTIDITYDNTNYSLAYDDFNENGIATKRTPQDDGNLEIGITGFNTTGYGDGTGQGGSTSITPYFSILTENGLCYTSLSETLDQDIRFNTGGGSSAMNIELRNINSCYGYYRMYGISGTLTYETVNTWAKNYDSEQIHYVPELNCFRSFAGFRSFTGVNYQYRLIPIIKPEELKVLFSLRLKTLIGSGSLFSHIYDVSINTNRYNEQNVPTGEILNGTYQSIVSKLRPWQLWDVDITANDFNPDDIPPYEPIPGDDKENTGSDIIRPATLGVGGTNGFITQYALTASQIGEIGRLLWLSFANIDYYKNFLFTLTTTGSIDLANLLDYFVSLRVYPFPLINVPSWASAGQDMYIGAGFIPLHFSSTIHTINNYADYIDAGTCDIPRSYGDFRDLTHCEIMLYLPYCGTVQLNPADVVGGTLHAQYAIDFATGGCIAYVDLYTWDGRQFMIAALSGSIGADIPLTATNATQIAARIASNALNVAGTIGNGVAGVAAEVPTIALGAATGNVPMAAMGAVGALGAEAGTAIGLAQDAMRIATQDAVKMPMMAGGRGFAGFGSPQTAYVQIRRGLYAEGHTAPQGFKQAYGNVYAKPVTVDSCTGFTVFANVDTSGLIAQADERDAIRSLMQSGIYI